ncbi:hypothetical protein RB597_010296 [Gaeumannomyces tritici]
MGGNSDCMFETMANLLCAPFSDEHLKCATSIYNNLPEVSTQPTIDEHLNFFSSLLRQHRLQDFFGFHLAHSHHPIPDNTILLGTSINLPDGTSAEKSIRRWAKPTLIEDVRGKQIHGHIYVVKPDGSLHPYEFQHGHYPVPSELDLGPFLQEFTKAVMEKELQDLIALEVLHPEDTDREPALEFIVDKVHHILVDGSVAKGWKQTRTTGWVLKVEGNGGARVLKGNVAYAPPPKNPSAHQAYTDGKPDAKPSTVSDVASALAALWK